MYNNFFYSYLYLQINIVLSAALYEQHKILNSFRTGLGALTTWVSRRGGRSCRSRCRSPGRPPRPASTWARPGRPSWPAASSCSWRPTPPASSSAGTGPRTTEPPWTSTGTTSLISRPVSRYTEWLYVCSVQWSWHIEILCWSEHYLIAHFIYDTVGYIIVLHCMYGSDTSECWPAQDTILAGLAWRHAEGASSRHEHHKQDHAPPPRTQPLVLNR